MTEGMYSSEFLLTHDIRKGIFADTERKEAQEFKKDLKKKGYKVHLKTEGDIIIVEGIKELSVKEAMDREKERYL
jgi:hypothetical protein